ncbi:MAG: WD40 repeat domain-containing protein [bacterium]|nr:WD40 repeat domain-containing protein [bacterium]
MDDPGRWDWDTGRREVAKIGEWADKFDWVEEPCASPDGEKIAAVVKTGEMEFGICENGNVWETAFDKVILLRFSPDNRLVGLVSDTGEWTVAVDGKTWENRFEFVWDPMLRGNHIIAAGQNARQYLGIIDDAPWENGFISMCNLTASDDGSRSAAVVQKEAFDEADIFKFQKGCYSVAVDGKTWDSVFVNVWEISFSPDGKHVAAPVRTTLHDYTIAVDGIAWDRTFASTWEPKFSPADNSVTAPVKVPGGWTLARDGEPIWKGRFVQLWNHIHSPDGKRTAALGAPKFGKWTMIVDDLPWDCHFTDLVMDPVFSPDGRRLACIGKTDGKWTVAVDGKPWTSSFDMAFKPVFSSDGRHVAAKVEKNGQYAVIVDGITVMEDLDAAWDPVFSPEENKILIRTIENGPGRETYNRHVIPLV